MKYILYIDYKASFKPMYYGYVEMNAKNLEEAIEEADKIWDDGNDTIYLARIMNKVGKVEAHEGFKSETYEAILCRRSYGWHRNTKENSENQHRVDKCWLKNNKNVVWYETR